MENNMELESFINQYLKPPAKILDLGAGDFSEVKKLEELGYEVEGVDLNIGVDLNKPYLSKNLPRDLVYSCFVLHYLNRKQTLIETAYNNLSQGGLFFLQDIERDGFTSDMYLTKKEIENLIKSGGFEIIESNIADYYDEKPEHKHWHKIVTVCARKK
jgi:hypothetical protein